MIDSKSHDITDDDGTIIDFSQRDPITAADRINELLGLEDEGLCVTGARVVGRGGAASVDLFVNGTQRLSFEQLRDIAKPMTLKTELAAQFGIARKINGDQAIEIVAAINVLAAHEVAFDRDEIARDWGLSFVQAAPAIDADVSDQRERWRAFQYLDGIDPVSLRNSGEVSSIAAGSPMIRDAGGTRLIRTGWFRAHVRAEESIASTELANRMQRVGWGRHGKTGRIKATRPDLDGELVWTFYAVPEGWESEGQVNE